MFSKETYASRLAKFCEQMAITEMDVAIITTPESITYLAGVEIGVAEMPQYLVITRDGGSAYIVREIEESWKLRWTDNSWCENWIGLPDSENFSDEVVRQVRKLTGISVVESLGCELNRTSTTYEEVTAWAASLQVTRLMSSTVIIEQMRAIKSDEERKHMRRVAEVTSKGMQASVDSIAKGGTEIDAERQALRTLEAAGSGPMPGGPWAASGPDTYLGHLSARPVKPEEGQLVTFMLSATIDRYVAPLERTYAMGNLAPETKKILATVRDALKLALDSIRPGMTSHEADAVVRDYYETRDLSRHFVNRLAYSIGIAYPTVWWEREIMEMRANDQRRLEPGMTFHVVPSLHIPTIGFIQSTMPIEITDTGCERLNDYPIDVPPIEIP